MALALLLAAQLAAAAPAQDCQAALGPLHQGTEESALPGQVEGSTLRNGAALLALRRARGDALITIRGGNFARADFRGARLHNICFLDTNFVGSDWRGARADGVGFIRANLSGAKLAGAHLARVLIRNANMDNANGARAVLAGGRLDGGWFEGSITNFRLDEADLTGFRFECGITIDDGCPVYQGGEQISLRGANLTRANLFGDDLTGARIDHTETGPNGLRDLRVARIEGPVLVRGGDAVVELSPEEYRAVLPHIRNPLAPERARGRPRSPPSWARPGVLALFVDAPLIFEDSFRDEPLYRRLLPALIGASSSRVAVRVRTDGGIDVGGDAIGANAHLCSIGGEGLRFDPRTGYYSGPEQPRADDPPERRGRLVPVLGLDGERAEVWASGRESLAPDPNDSRIGDYASCGMRASFSPMVRVPADMAAIDRMLDESLR